MGIARAGSGATVGALEYFPGTAAPPGWLKANGGSVLRADYPALWAYAQASGNLVAQGSKALGNFGTGNGTTTFTLPDYRAEFIRGWDDGKGVDGGRAIGAWQDSSNKQHTHAVDYATDPNGGGTYIDRLVRSTGNGTSLGSANAGVVFEGSTEAKPRNVAALVCIRFRR